MCVLRRRFHCRASAGGTKSGCDVVPWLLMCHRAEAILSDCLIPHPGLLYMIGECLKSVTKHVKPACLLSSNAD